MAVDAEKVWASHSVIKTAVDDLRTTIDEQVSATDMLKDIFLGSEKEDSDGDMYNLENWEGGLADEIKALKTKIAELENADSKTY